MAAGPVCRSTLRATGRSGSSSPTGSCRRRPGTVVLHPPSLVVGVGASTGAPADAVAALLDRAPWPAPGWPAESVAEVATIDRRATEPGHRRPSACRCGRSRPTRWPPSTCPTPSEVVRAAVGTASVAEAAALLAAGPGAELVVTKRVAAQATVAVARRGRSARPPGRRRPRARAAPPTARRRRRPAVRAAEVVIGYGPYVDQCADLLDRRPRRSSAAPSATRRCGPSRRVAEAAAGRRVALVCSGDAGVYAMASLVLEVAGDAGVDVEVVPGRDRRPGRGRRSWARPSATTTS